MPPGFYGHGRHRHCQRGPMPQRIDGFIEPALLLLLRIDPTHGYGLMEGLQKLWSQDYPVDSSAVYRTLRGLEELGMVTSAWDTTVSFGPPRRVYQVTADGEEYLAHWVADLRATDRVLHAFLEAYDRQMPQAGEHSDQQDQKGGEQDA